MDPIVFILGPIAIFGGMAGVIGAAGWAKAERIRAERTSQAQTPQDTAQNTAMAAELQALKHQIGEMQATSHQFDISFDAALSRLEERVNRVETKVATTPVGPQAESPQRVGLR